MRAHATVALALCSALLATSAAAAPERLSFLERMKVRLAPVRVTQSARGLSVTHLGLEDGHRIVKEKTTQLKDGTQIKLTRRTMVLDKAYRGVEITRTAPDGTVTHTLKVPGLPGLSRSWTEQGSYSRMTALKSKTQAVLASPLTQSAVLGLATGGLVYAGGFAGLAAVKSFAVSNLFPQSFVWLQSGDALRAKVTDLR